MFFDVLVDEVKYDRHPKRRRLIKSGSKAALIRHLYEASRYRFDREMSEV